MNELVYKNSKESPLMFFRRGYPATAGSGWLTRAEKSQKTLQLATNPNNYDNLERVNENKPCELATNHNNLSLPYRGIGEKSQHFTTNSKFAL